MLKSGVSFAEVENRDVRNQRPAPDTHHGSPMVRVHSTLSLTDTR